MINSISPISFPLDSTSQTLDIFGSELASTTAYFDGGNATLTTFINSGESSAPVPNNILAISGTHTLYVTKTVNGQIYTSNTVTFAVLGGHNEYCNSSDQWTGPASDGPATAPTSCFNTALANTPSPGSTVTVIAGSCSSLQTAVNNAVAGETIVVPSQTSPGVQAIYNCQITPSIAGNASNWITLETDQLASLPPEGGRVSPAFVGIASLPSRPAYSQPINAGIYMPKIVSNGPTVNFGSTAAYWRLVGLELTTTGGVNTTQVIVLPGSGSHIILDRSLVHGGNNSSGQDRDNIQAAVRIYSTPYSAVIDSYLYDTHCIANTGTCSDSQAVFVGGSACSSDGPIKVVDNFLETGGEAVFSGGGGCGSGTLPATDVEVRLNHFFKPLFWKANDPSYFGTQFLIKNHLEYKNTVRSWIEGNILDQTWGYQSDQHGIAVLFDSRNQNVSYSGSAASDGSGTLTWLSGAKFMSNITSPNCAVPNECLVTYGNGNYHATTYISPTQVQVTPAPPVASSASFTAYEPGLNSSADVTDIVFRLNYITHAADGLQIANPPSDGGDLSLGGARFAVENDAMDDIDGPTWVVGNGACCAWGTGFQVQNTESNNLHDISIWHNTILTTVATSNTSSSGASFGLGNQSISGSLIGNLRIYDNISAGGWWSGSANICGTGITAQEYWNCWTPVAQKCFDNNFLANSTYPTSGTGSYAHDNTPYPQPADNGYCSYGTAKGNTSVTDYTTFQFVNLNGANGGDYQLSTTSPYVGLASDGTDPGVNWTALQNAIAGVQ